MISIENVAAVTLFASIGWLGGWCWLRLIFPEIRQLVMIFFLPPVMTAAVIIVLLTVLNRLGVPIAFWSVSVVVALNALIPGTLVLFRRTASKKSQ